jgi:hypothetical protein
VEKLINIHVTHNWELGVSDSAVKEASISAGRSSVLTELRKAPIHLLKASLPFNMVSSYQSGPGI